MKLKNYCWIAAVAAAMVIPFSTASAQDTPAPVSAETCTACHADQAAAFNGTRHAKKMVLGKKIAADKTCEACHGNGSQHAASGDKTKIFNPGKAGGEKASEACLSCHSSDKNRLFWRGSAHEGKGNSCVSCHKVHGGGDQLLAKNTQSELCFTCHQDVKADLAKRSKHPLKDPLSKTGEGKMNCSSCHNPHGARAEKLIDAKSINDKCYECHTEKQAPMLWEHAPVKEDCMTCHSPHGSSNNKMLVVKPPRLCQSCHMQGRHQSGALASNSIYTDGRSCLNCHSMVHGSNHPSGTVLQR